MNILFNKITKLQIKAFNRTPVGPRFTPSLAPCLMQRELNEKEKQLLWGGGSKWKTILKPVGKMRKHVEFAEWTLI